MDKRRMSDEKIILKICELYLRLVENEIAVKPFADNEARENFKKHISGDIEEEIRGSTQYLNLKAVLMSRDNKDKIERTIKTFVEMLEKKGIVMNVDDERTTYYLKKWTLRHMKKRK